MKSKFYIYLRGKWLHLDVWPDNTELLERRFKFGPLKTKDKVFPKSVVIEKIPNSHRLKITAII